jgi:hypothetical protein
MHSGVRLSPSPQRNDTNGIDLISLRPQARNSEIYILLYITKADDLESHWAEFTECLSWRYHVIMFYNVYKIFINALKGVNVFSFP